MFFKEKLLVLQHPQARHGGDGQGEADGARARPRPGLRGDGLHDGGLLRGAGDDDDELLLVRQRDAEELLRPLRAGALGVQHRAAGRAGGARGVHHLVRVPLVGDDGYQLMFKFPGRRGRVGRGAADSCCILISDNENDAVKERLRFLCHTSDGFAVAKYDLENRGPGDFFGSAQHGLPTLRVADLVQDTRTLKVAQEEAKALLAVDPNLAMPQHRALSDEVDRLFATAGAMN